MNLVTSAEWSSGRLINELARHSMRQLGPTTESLAEPGSPAQSVRGSASRDYRATKKAHVLQLLTPRARRQLKTTGRACSDVIGPDDFRAPFAKLKSTDPDGAFDLWLRRRTWVDDSLNSISPLKDWIKLLAVMNGHIIYAGQTVLDGKGNSIAAWAQITSLSDLDTLLANLNQAKTAKDAQQKIANELHLQIDSFRRLMEIVSKSELDQKVTDDEWSEVASILVQAQKTSLSVFWRQEEEETAKEDPIRSRDFLDLHPTLPSQEPGLRHVYQCQ